MRIRILVSIFAVLLIASGAYFIFSGDDTTPTNNDAEVKGETEVIATSEEQIPAESTDLESKLYEAIRPYPGLKVGVSVFDLDTQNQAHISRDYEFIAASTTKVMIATYTYNQAESGNVNLDSILNPSEQKPESYTPISFRENIRWMITQSDNESWKDLMEYFGYSNYQAYVNSLGFESFKTEGNLITANDMASFLKQLKNGQLINSQNQEELLYFMSRSWTGPLELKTEYQSIERKAGWLEDRMHLVGLIGPNDDEKSFAIYVETTDASNLDYQYSSNLVNDLLDVIAQEQV